MKIRDRILYRGPGLTHIEKLQLELFYTYQRNYYFMIRRRVSAFDTDGSMEVTKADGSTYKQDGRKWINAHIKYFEEKDHQTYYLMCAELVKVLNEYDEKFKKV